MPSYRVFGGILDSAVELPELPEAIGGAREDAARVLYRVDDLPPSPAASGMGSEAVQAGVEVRLRDDGDGWRLEYDDTGTFEVSVDGREIAWLPPGPSVDMNAVRMDVLGRVMAVALHRSGVPSLHGSAVVLDGEAVVFLAPKGYGKSTTALALVEAGASLLADDTVAVSGVDRPVVLPGVPTAQLWRDSAARLAPEETAGHEDPGNKVRLSLADSGSVADREAPLAAVYLLRPVPAANGNRPERVRLDPRTAVLALVGQSKIGRLLGVRAMPELLRRMQEMAASVPVYTLTVPRDFGLLPRVVERLEAWHRQPAARAVGPSGA